MSEHQGAHHHNKAAEHHEHAAKHHRLAAQHHDSGEHEKALTTRMSPTVTPLTPWGMRKRPASITPIRIPGPGPQPSNLSGASRGYQSS